MITILPRFMNHSVQHHKLTLTDSELSLSLSLSLSTRARQYTVAKAPKLCESRHHYYPHFQHRKTGDTRGVHV